MSSSRRAEGFSLMEIAIVLVIIGLLIGGVIKGQELIESAKVKNLANDFRAVASAVYAYQDRFKALPGDDARADIHLSGATVATTSAGSGAIDSAWNAYSASDESVLLWQHLRLANLWAGPSTVSLTGASPSQADSSGYLPVNAAGGRLGVVTAAPISGMSGSLFLCSGGLDGKLAAALDTLLDDGQPNSGAMRVALAPAEASTTALADVGARSASNPASGKLYVACSGL